MYRYCNRPDWDGIAGPAIWYRIACSDYVASLYSQALGLSAISLSVEIIPVGQVGCNASAVRNLPQLEQPDRWFFTGLNIQVILLTTLLTGVGILLGLLL